MGVVRMKEREYNDSKGCFESSRIRHTSIIGKA